MTFLKYTQKGLLKNVQDGISRPLRSREITKSKGEGFFTNPLFGNVAVDMHLLTNVHFCLQMFLCFYFRNKSEVKILILEILLFEFIVLH